MNHITLFFTLLLASFGPLAFGQSTNIPVLKVGDKLQLFLDDWLIESQTLKGVEFAVHRPQPAEAVLRRDKPWENVSIASVMVMKDDDRYRLWYRARAEETTPYVNLTGYAESKDGVNWIKPTLGIIEFNGSKQNNLVLSSPTGRDISVFKDTRPGAASGERYKAIGLGANMNSVVGFTSPDGIHWKPLAPQIPLLFPYGKPYDTQNIAFWDSARRRYVAYVRRRDAQNCRTLGYATTLDFRQWPDPEILELNVSPEDEIYLGAATPYYRRPDMLLMFTMRFNEKRRFDPLWPHTGISDIGLMSSRDGLRWRQHGRSAIVPPGPNLLNWHDRAVMPAVGLVPTGKGEMSLYYIENYRSDDVQIRRAVLREDGLVSVRAGYEGGEFTTKAFVFDGNRLVINYATDIVGHIRVELLDADSKLINGYDLNSCPEIFGDELARVVNWSNPNVSKFIGQAVRLRFVMKNADLYSFHFKTEKPQL